jgi:transposase
MSRAASRKPYPSDVSDEEWSLVVPYLTLMKEDAPQREYPMRELFNGLRYVIRYGIAWRAMPNDLPPWHAVHQQAQLVGGGTQGGADGGDHRQPSIAFDAGKRHPRGL